MEFINRVVFIGVKAIMQIKTQTEWWHCRVVLFFF